MDVWSATTMEAAQQSLAYTFTVTATNDVGTGPPSAPSPSVTPSSGWTVSLSANKTSANPGETITLTASPNADVGSTYYDLEIYDTATGTVVDACFTGWSCSTDVSESGISRSFQARVSYYGGGNLQATSGPVTVTWAAWAVGPSASKTSATPDEQVTLTATTNADLGSTYYVQIYDTATGIMVWACSTG